MALLNKLILLSIVLVALSACLSKNLPRVKLENVTDIQLKYLNGRYVLLKNLIKENEANVFIWWGSSCPCVVRYKSRIKALTRDFANKKVAFFAISSNVDDTLARINQTPKNRRFNIQLLKDPHAQLAASFGIKTTPTTIILDSNGQLLYKGWIDNEKKPEQKGRIAYLQKAITDILRSQKVKKSKSPTYGCLITKSLKYPFLL